MKDYILTETIEQPPGTGPAEYFFPGILGLMKNGDQYL